MQINEKMDKIIEFKSLNKFDNYEEAFDYADKRVASVFSGFKERKKNLLEFTNPSIENLERALKELGVYFTRERSFFDMVGTLCYADFYLPYFNIVIEVDGEYHNNTKQQWIDKQKELFIAKRSIATVRFTNIESLAIEKFDHIKMLEDAETFWEENHLKNTEEYRNWQSRIYTDKKYVIQKLKFQCPDIVSKLEVDRVVLLVDKKEGVMCEFKNVFFAHFHTGIKFKTIGATLLKEKGFKRFIYKGEEKLI